MAVSLFYCRLRGCVAQLVRSAMHLRKLGGGTQQAQEWHLASMPRKEGQEQQVSSDLNTSEHSCTDTC